MKGNLFQEEGLYKWLNKNGKTCPLTRSILNTDSVRPCHTMKRLVDIMKSHDISSDFLTEMLTQMNDYGQRKITETLVEHSTEEKIKEATQPSSSQLRKARRKRTIEESRRN